jgi:hypothetical protein
MSTAHRVDTGGLVGRAWPRELLAGAVTSVGAGTGALMRPAAVRRYAAEAGYPQVRILPIEDDFFRCYRLDR